MLKTKVKICGLRREEEIMLAAQLGVEAIGFVLYPKSKRALSLAQAAQLRRTIPAGLKLVVLMVNPSVKEVQDVIAQLAPDIIQFHGDESGAFCEQFHYPYWRAVRVGAPYLQTTADLQHYIHQYPHAQKFLFDAYSACFGGAGIRFDLSLLDGLHLPVEHIVIAGGIHEGNVDELLNNYDFIDLSSGVEESPGVKSLDKMKSFMQKVNQKSIK
ncbi:phosphoribosylanthranilate isomerase [Pelistega europaea]|uniref:N-(5'-phosphoribosyl)anthranilate isomerase n=1 Tax=Pelistega europaea TaxID=106147 RepID=A0A7Y4P5L3_9BURK|nr:phosphoribosylanthranilate isomerase [Pelistega europaea]NOL48855.1 phosphoribosylanthranilate isomerase [Pelistega europaea]